MKIKDRSYFILAIIFFFLTVAGIIYAQTGYVPWERYNQDQKGMEAKLTSTEVQLGKLGERIIGIEADIKEIKELLNRFVWLFIGIGFTSMVAGATGYHAFKNYKVRNNKVKT